jgi:hypothetical protein
MLLWKWSWLNKEKKKAKGVPIVSMRKEEKGR